MDPVEAARDRRKAANLALVRRRIAEHPELGGRLLPGWEKGGSRLRMTMLQLGIEPILYDVEADYDPRYELALLRRRQAYSGEP